MVFSPVFVPGPCLSGHQAHACRAIIKLGSHHQCAVGTGVGREWGLPQVSAQLGTDPGAASNLHQLPCGLTRPPRCRVGGPQPHALHGPGLPPESDLPSFGPSPPAQGQGSPEFQPGALTYRILRDTLPMAPTTPRLQSYLGHGPVWTLTD